MPTDRDQYERSDSNLTNRENAASLAVAAIAGLAVAAWLLGPEGRVGLAIGAMCGAFLVFAIWLAEQRP